MRDVMLDLETFGTGPTAAIVQIGAYRFDSGLNEASVLNIPGGHMLCLNVSLQSAMLAGCTIDADTIDFWQKPEQADARKSLNATPILSLPEALHTFTKWFTADGESQFIWGHGASFDIPILDHAYRLLGQATPWNYRDVRDTRTLFQVAKNWCWSAPKRMPEQTLHDGGYDAEYQAQCVESAVRHIKHRVAGPGDA